MHERRTFLAALIAALAAPFARIGHAARTAPGPHDGPYTIYTSDKMAAAIESGPKFADEWTGYLNWQEGPGVYPPHGGRLYDANGAEIMEPRVVACNTHTGYIWYFELNEHGGLIHELKVKHRGDGEAVIVEELKQGTRRYPAPLHYVPRA